MSYGIKRALKEARKRAAADIAASRGENSGTFYGKGLAGEGYSGGYLAALDDVMLALDCGIGNGNSRYWPTRDEMRRKRDGGTR